MFHDKTPIDCVASAITTSLAVISIALVQVTATGKQKILVYVGCNVSGSITVLHDDGSNINIVATTPSNDEIMSMPMLSPSLKLPSDPFGKDHSLVSFHPDLAISNSFLSLGGGLESSSGLSYATPKMLAYHLLA